MKGLRCLFGFHEYQYKQMNVVNKVQTGYFFCGYRVKCAKCGKISILDDEKEHKNIIELMPRS
jgi:hypothetical protein